MKENKRIKDYRKMAAQYGVSDAQIDELATQHAAAISASPDKENEIFSEKDEILPKKKDSE